MSRKLSLIILVLTFISCKSSKNEKMVNPKSMIVSKIEYMNNVIFDPLEKVRMNELFYIYDKRNLKKEEYKIKISKVGFVSISDNRLSISDVFIEKDKYKFDVDFPNGSFDLYFIEVFHKPSKSTRIMYSVIDFKKSINKWKTIMTETGKTHQLIIDSGLCYYRTVDNAIIDVHENFESRILDKISTIPFDKPSYINYNENREKAIVFSTAFGDGAYKSYCAFDENNIVSMVFTDFSL